jgi:hypothetical protein
MMSGLTQISMGALAALAIACSGGGTGGKKHKMTMDEGMTMMGKGSHESSVGELTVGKGFESWKKVDTKTYLSRTHGKRFVRIHVNDIGYQAYISGKPMPVGSVVVKPSWQAKDGKPTDIKGPVFVMEKKAAGYDDENENWYYAIYWPDPTPEWKKKLGGPIYWQSPSKKVSYCIECHEGYDRYLGMPPKDARVSPGAASE